MRESGWICVRVSGGFVFVLFFSVCVWSFYGFISQWSITLTSVIFPRHVLLFSIVFPIIIFSYIFHVFCSVLQCKQILPLFNFVEFFVVDNFILISVELNKYIIKVCICMLKRVLLYTLDQEHTGSTTFFFRNISITSERQ